MISLVYVIKFVVSCGFGHINWNKSLLKNFIFCAVTILEISEPHRRNLGYKSCHFDMITKFCEHT